MLNKNKNSRKFYSILNNKFLNDFCTGSHNLYTDWLHKQNQQPWTLSLTSSVNKQLADKERVAAALENQHLLNVVNQCLQRRATGWQPVHHGCHISYTWTQIDLKLDQIRQMLDFLNNVGVYDFIFCLL